MTTVSRYSNVTNVLPTMTVAYADDLAVLARDRNSLKETTTLIENETNKRDLYINKHKIKYVTVERGRKQATVREIQIQNDR